ncbi:hypothetical protein [Mesorhizobium helmanticense]|uniref:hypothetical protein n=1 Tax=Mesorhizobium helmanticense TaxID=1776423 RepID=UPI0011B241E0|nr:hypothetical protein [Mesorhizobium helmanticense]
MKSSAISEKSLQNFTTNGRAIDDHACPRESRLLPRLSEYTALVRASTNPEFAVIENGAFTQVDARASETGLKPAFEPPSSCESLMVEKELRHSLPITVILNGRQRAERMRGVGESAP